MYAIKLSLKNLLLLAFVVCLFSVFFNPLVVYARTSEEIAADKQSKQKELDALNAELKKAQQSLNLNLSQKTASLSEIEKIKSELTQIDEELKINTLKKQQLEQEIGIKALEKEEKEQEQDVQIAGSYISWKTQDESYLILGGEDILKNAIYYNYVTETSKDSILGLTTELDSLKKSNEEHQKQIDSLAQEDKALEEKKVALEKQISQINTNIAKTKTNVGAIKQKISLISAEQQALLNLEKQATQGDGKGGTLDITSGQFYFSGQGYDGNLDKGMGQGHSVGMSQYGAKGYAANGWNAESILKLYYTGVEVVDYFAFKNETEEMSTHLNIIYCENAPTTDTPPCDNGKVSKNVRVQFDDYLGGLGEMPESWPLEARKAQLIGARTYAINYTDNGSPDKPICLTQQCQVNYLKAGENPNDYFHDGDLDVTMQTKNKIIHYQGQLITAVYSSDNSQGSGTANNDTIWSNVYGVGSPLAYLRHVNDTQFTEKTQWTDWKWRTNGYNMQQINDMVQNAASNPENVHSIRTINTVGTITGISFTKDPSGRVKVVTLSGSKGSIDMAGWYFKAIWNIWISAKKPSGQYDYIYSLTWNYQAQQ